MKTAMLLRKRIFLRHIKYFLLTIVGLSLSVPDANAQWPAMQKRLAADSILIFDDSTALRMLWENGYLKQRFNTMRVWKVERIEALRRLIEISDQSTAGVDSFTSLHYMKRLLKINPEYRLRVPVEKMIGKKVQSYLWTKKTTLSNIRDYNEIGDLYRKFRVRPISIGFSSALLLPQVKVDSAFNINYAPADSNEYSSPAGRRHSVFTHFFFNRWLAASAELGWEDVRIKRSFQSHNFTTVEFTESDWRLTGSVGLRGEIEFPTRLKTRGTFAKISVGPALGVTGSYLYTSRLLTITRSFPQTPIEAITTDSDYSLLAQRNPQQMNLYAGIGFRMKWDKLHFHVDLHYQWGKSLWNNPDNRFGNATLLYQYFLIDDDFKVNLFSICAGVSYNIYRIKFDPGYRRLTFRERMNEKKEERKYK